MATALQNIAIIGIGRMGLRYVQTVHDLHLKLSGVCDQNRKALDQIGERQGISERIRFTDAYKLLKETKPECVIIATTTPSHCVYTCLAAELGIRKILCEKPMAVSLSDCDKIIQICKQHNIELAVNHAMRFMERYREPKRIVRSPEFGGLTSVTVVGGNLGLAMNGTHYFEMFRFMTDEEPYAVTAWFSPEKVPNPRGPEFEDRAGSVRVTTKSGKRFYMEVGSDQGHGVKVIYAGPHGQLVVDELAGTMTLNARKKEHRNEPTTRYAMPSVETTKKITPADSVGPTRTVLEALLNGQNFPTGEEGRLAVATLVAAYVSDESGHLPVKVDDHLPLDRKFPWA